MNLDTLKKRTARILTTPPEILYAISRHWAIIACCLVLGLILLLPLPVIASVRWWSFEYQRWKNSDHPWGEG